MYTQFEIGEKAEYLQLDHPDFDDLSHTQCIVHSHVFTVHGIDYVLTEPDKRPLSVYHIPVSRLKKLTENE